MSILRHLVTSIADNISLNEPNGYCPSFGNEVMEASYKAVYELRLHLEGILLPDLEKAVSKAYGDSIGLAGYCNQLQFLHDSLGACLPRIVADAVIGNASEIEALLPGIALSQWAHSHTENTGYADVTQ